MNQKITIDYRSRFIEFYFNELQTHPIFQEMNSLAEESPWHREGSIGIHTNMVVSEFISRSPNKWEQVDVVGAMAPHELVAADAMEHGMHDGPVARGGIPAPLGLLFW